METEAESVPETLSVSSIDWALENIQTNICVINNHCHRPRWM